jgi:hypothetical protein
MEERERFTERWHGAIRDWPRPLTLAWGMRDPVARVWVLDCHQPFSQALSRSSSQTPGATRRSSSLI